MPRAFFLFLTAFPLFAQFSGLATTDDGTQLYFSSSLQLNGTTNENSYSKIFRYDGSGFHLVAQTDKVAAPGGINLPTTNPYNLTSAYVSGNGSVFGYVGTADCPGPCYYQGFLQTTLQYPGELFPTILPYGCALSKNAQYAMCIVSGRQTHENYGVLNLFANTQTPIYYPSCGQSIGFPRDINSDGRILCGSTLWSASGSETLKLQGDSFGPLLSDDASRVVSSSGNSLYFYNVATGAQSSVAFQSAQFVNPLGISNNGGAVLFTLQHPGITQLAYIHTDGTGFLQLTTDPTGVNSAVLSGDGSTAYAVTYSGKLLKVDTTSGFSTLITTAAQVQQVQGAGVPGSLSSIEGAGLADATISASTFPLSTSLGGAQVTVNGTPTPILAVAPYSISFQIPWETPLGNAAIAVVRPASQFVQAPTQVQIRAIEPFAVLNQAISQDFSQLNDAMHPAKPGDILNFYLTGLGGVTVPVADGALSPSNPLPILANPVSVLFGTTPLKVFYAGLAPGLVGIYQLSCLGRIQRMVVRIDKWLWAARFFKTRALAARACELGRVDSNGQQAKAARQVRAGDMVRVKNDGGEFQLEVLGVSEMRGPAAVAQTLYRETEASREARVKAAEERKAQMQFGDGKPSKRDRREIGRLRGRE